MDTVTVDSVDSPTVLLLPAIEVLAIEERFPSVPSRNWQSIRVLVANNRFLGRSVLAKSHLGHG